MRGERAVSGASLPSTGLRFEELRAAVAETPCLQRGVTDADLMSLWEVFDANSDGVLDRDELPSMYDPAGPDHWSAEPSPRQGGKAGKSGGNTKNPLDELDKDAEKEPSLDAVFVRTLQD